MLHSCKQGQTTAQKAPEEAKQEAFYGWIRDQ